MTEQQLRRLVDEMQAYADDIAEKSGEIEANTGPEGYLMAGIVGLFMQTMADCLRTALEPVQ